MQSRAERSWAAVVRHEFVQLAALIAIAVAGFFATRLVAAGNRTVAARDAEAWFQRGRTAMAAGRVDDAIAALRRAVSRKRGSREYALELARALALRGDAAGARQQLLGLRETAPEDPVVNVELARIAAEHGDTLEARRFYYNALYAPWAPEQAEERRRIRMELIRVLVDSGDQKRALSELVAASVDLPPDAPHQTQIAELFAGVGDQARALTHFQQALATAPDNAPALAGAGMAAFSLGDYALARRYFQRAPDTAGPIADRREVVDLVLTGDPLAPRLGAAERRRRVTAAIVRADQRLAQCTVPPPDQSSDEAAALRAQLASFQPRVSRGPIDQDTAEDALDLTFRIETYAGARCAPAAPVDRALTLIAARHGSGVR